MERTFSIVVSQKTIIIKKECLFLNKHTLAVQLVGGWEKFNDFLKLTSPSLEMLAFA